MTLFDRAGRWRSGLSTFRGAVDASPQPNIASGFGTAGLPAGLWLLVLLTGIGSGLAAGLLMALLRLVEHFAWAYREGTSLAAIERTGDVHRLLVLAGTGVLVAAVLPLIGRFTRGGLGDLEASIWFDDGRIPPLRTAAKAVFSIVIVGLGASLGRESAPKQAGALIGGALAQRFSIGGAERRLLAACGAGAGISAVYNVPFGGALFTLEVLLGTLALPLVPPVLLATLSGTAAAWLLLPIEPTYQLPRFDLTFALAAFAVLAGPVAGVASAAFVKLVAATAAFKLGGRRQVALALVVFAGLGGLAIPYPGLLGNGRDIVELAGLGRLTLPTLAALALLKPLATAACLYTGAPGGLFTPSIATGAMLGGALAAALLLLPLPWPPGLLGAGAIVFAAAMLAGTTKGPVSAVLLMLELTGRLDGALLPMLIASVIATVVAHRLDPRSTYSSRLPTTGDQGPGGAVSSAARYGELLRRSAAQEEPLRVADVEGRVIGRLGRADLAGHAGPGDLLAITTAIDLVEAKASRAQGAGGATGAERANAQ